MAAVVKLFVNCNLILVLALQELTAYPIYNHPNPSGIRNAPSSSASSVRPSSSASSVQPSSSASLHPSASAPTRSSSRTSTRPASSASIRPSSSASTRPPSSASSVRPAPSASRPASRATQRPISRFSQRPSTRQSLRLLPFYQELVTQVTGLTAESDQENFRTAVDFVSRNLDQTARPSGSTDFATVDKHVRGHAQKARINSYDTLATALETSYKKLKNQSQNCGDLDAEIQLSRLPDHLQLLMLLSLPPVQSTLDFAEKYLDGVKNPSKMPSILTWKDILADEPFEGQHWEGAYGLPPGSTVENWDSHSEGSTPSLSPWDDSDDLDDSRSSSELLDDVSEPPQIFNRVDIIPTVMNNRPTNIYQHRKDVEDLYARQYWRADWHPDVPNDRSFNIGDPSTLGPSFHQALAERTTLKIHDPAKERYIYEHDAVREILMALQGRRNIMLSWVHHGPHAFSFVQPSSSPRLLHLTSGAQTSILMSFAKMATTLEHLRKFVIAIFAKTSQAMPATESKPAHLASLSRRSTRTLEAFSDAVDSQLRGFDKWCAAKEEEICLAQGGIGPPLVVSLLSLEKALRDTFSATFNVLLEVLRDVIQRAQRSPDPIIDIWTLPDLPTRISPPALTALLLDSLLDAVQSNISIGDVVTSSALMNVFSETAEPVWSMIGQWMKDGMPVRDVIVQNAARQEALDDEFFIEDNEVAMLDPDFWAEGFTLRNGQADEQENRPTSVPVFLAHIAELVLGTGKVIGLLRALGIPALFDREEEQQWLADWRSFKHSSIRFFVQVLVIIFRTASPSFKDNRSCLAHEILTKVLVEDCDLWLHLAAMEDLFLMRRGDAMSHFVDVLFSRMDSRLPWNDFHFMNSAFRDIADLGAVRWIDSSLVRISHRGNKDKNVNQTVKAIDGLLIEYAVPFPLTYIFGPRTMQVYSSIFAFVLQIRRAKSTLERILVRDAFGNASHMDGEMKVFYAMRSRLSWFINTLLNFIATNVLHTQVLSFHSAFGQVKSLDEMIRLHNEHLDKIEGRCLLQRNTSALHRAIISILDMTLHYSDCFVAFAGDTTHDISRGSVSMMKRHRSRRQRQQKKNIIGFSMSLREARISSDSDSDTDGDLAEGNDVEPSFSMATSSISFAEEGFVTRLDRMSTELDALVRFIRRGVESLAAGTGEAAAAFGIFAFALEDWDR
ncbi:Gamma-tubulin complex component 5 [Grifola frondosa]|uniref:Gamma-tubulin complex component 5 n=1 Tax=Grifola frondosa TaxID=5627 RepID=A0A1C7M609_GRIFR|nr:Gamma-tubulin complex component 5 [Grifola frondosa]